ncbi:MAG: hypothetical protein J5823_02765 [Paludibacteraceae bacterium]|jgi:hypothetical protein|nr:hypothetical protein [Paludibacteraceae bacterium]
MLESTIVDDQERELLDYIIRTVPAEDLYGLTEDDILYVLDVMDDYLIMKGLASENEEEGDIEYSEGYVDETEQLQYILEQAKADKVPVTSVQVQLIQDAEYRYGVENGFYSEDEA